MSDRFADLHRPVYGPGLLITVLERNRDKPALYFGDTILTGGQMRDLIRLPARSKRRTSTPTAWRSYRRTTGKYKGVVGSFRSGAALNQIQMSERQWSEENRFPSAPRSRMWAQPSSFRLCCAVAP
ncbi:hypothetical protein ABH922_003686 [Rhodococcus sp. 27YEA15]|uniref:hypothetical protein n=1 Tax=Rhodococcus sp. 27YEA15 TaxID=3156259 RepID=UPI003C7B6E3B